MHVAWLGEPASLDAATVGGKTANLGRLATSFHVPPGFCLDATVHERLGGALEGEAWARDELHQLVVDAYTELAKRLGTDAPLVAVRSSAIGEDSIDASFAGQYETILNVAGAHAVVDAVLDCWRSLSTERSMAYRRERGITKTPHIAVLVQQMVEPDVSAIAFSADPVSGARNIIVVNAARGLGDAIASGTVTPDSFSVRKGDLEIIDRRIANGQPISDEHVRAIARLAAQLEEVMTWPVDIECAIRDEVLHLLQCRPITTLAEEFPVAWDDPEDAKLTWQREDAHFDRVMGPLAIEFVRNGPDHGIQQRFVDIGFPLLVRHRAFNGRFYASEKPLVPEERIAEELTGALNFRRGFARTLRRQWDGELLPELHEHYAWMRGLAPAEMPGDGASAAWLEMWRRVNRIWTIHFMVTGSAYPVMEELAQAYEKLVGGNGAEALAITQGQAPTLQRLERDLHEFVESTRQRPKVAAALAEGERSVNKLARLEGGPEFARALEDFLGVHGGIGQENFDLESPAWRDDPAKVLAVLAQRLRSEGEHPDARALRVRAHGTETLDRARARLAGRPEDLARFEEVLAAASSAGPLTEEHNYWIDRICQAQVRRLSFAFGERLVADGALASADEIFLLYVDEITDALRTRAPLGELVSRRRHELARWRRLASPTTIGTPRSGPEVVTPGVALERVSFEYSVAQDDRYTLKGVAASAGVARGPARLITGDDDFSKMRAGDVLVCRQSTVSWASLFTMAAAVVTEIGGALCHAAVVAREFGVPCVVATGGVLTTLTDGEPLEVDGSSGKVRRLFPVTWHDPDDANIVWRRDDAHQTNIRTPLGIDYTLQGAAYGMRKRDEELGPPVLARVAAFNGRMYNSTKPLRPPEEMPQHQQNAIARRRRLARRIRRDWDDRFLPELNESYAWMAALDPASMGRDEAAAAWDGLWRRHRRAWTIHMLVTASAYTVTDEFGQIYEQLVGGPALEAFSVTQALAPALQRLDSDLAALTEKARPLAEAIERGATLEELNAADPSFGTVVAAFLTEHGHLGQPTEGLGILSWSDEPSLLIGSLRMRLLQPPADPAARLARQRRDADDIVRRAREHLATRPEDLERFEEVLAAVTSAGPLTEEHNYWLDRRNQARMGTAVRRFGERLVREGALPDVESIFLLYVSEIREALRNPIDLAALLAERRAEQQSWMEMESPETLGAPAPAWQREASTRMAGQGFLLYREKQTDPSRMLRGVGASAGVGRGPARLIRDQADFPKFKAGDVLVCQASNVSWVPLFASAAAVITEVGGALSHAAVVAREVGVPAVVGTGIALSTLVDGEPVEVDGSAGTVRRLSA